MVDSKALLDAVECIGTPVPDLVFPDTETGRNEARRLFTDSIDNRIIGLYFCPNYEQRKTSTLRGAKEICDRRHPASPRCRNCPAGYMFEGVLGTLPD